MFEILPNPSLETVLVIARAALLVGAFWIFAIAFIRWRRADERNAQALQAQLERAFVEMRSLHETVSVMSARLESLGDRAESDARLAPAGVVSSQRGYDLAARLVKNGAGIDELVSTCGITRHEAELLTHLHSARSREMPPVGRQPRPASMETQQASARPAPAQNNVPPPPANQQGMRKRGSLLSVVS